MTVSWKVRIGVLLGVTRAIKHLHCHSNPPIIHRDVKSSNILLDVNWVTRLSDFGVSVKYQHMASEEYGLEAVVIGTVGYLDPMYLYTGYVKPTSDLYSLGVLMLEVLTGENANFQWEDGKRVNASLTMLALPIIEAGNLGDLLDRRPVPEPTPGQLRALEQVAQTAACCVKLNEGDRPAISDIVANLEMALELICQDEPSTN